MKTEQNKSSDIAGMAHVFLVKPHHSTVESSILDANNVDFMVLWRCGALLWTQQWNVKVTNHECKVKRYGTFAGIQLIVGTITSHY